MTALGPTRGPLALATAALLVTCKQEQWPGPKAEVGAPPAVLSESVVAQAAPVSLPPDRSRILLTPARLAALDALAQARHPAWTAVVEACKEASTESIPSGYEAWDWAQAALNCGLIYRTTHDETYARTAMIYFKAMLDDREKVGDGKGGDAIVHHDSGYPIRTHGMMGAIAYDWLRDAPAMTNELRKHAVDRFVSWSDWFKAAGYNRDKPISNYYMGWFGALGLGGIAADDDDARASAMRVNARERMQKELGPALEKLAGGDWPEGWQYGSLAATILAIYADAEGASAKPALPWLGDVVSFRTYALWPDGQHLFDNGDWEKKPAVAPANEDLSIAILFPPTDPLGAHALFLAALARQAPGAWPWLRALATDPSKRPTDPRRGPLSYVARGGGTVFARSSWKPDAVWVALTSSAYTADHQHADAGHFEIVRGADALVIDPGGYGSYATMSHNTILIDDGRENMPYAPNQGAWGKDCALARYEDVGDLVYAEASFGSAYDPPGYPGDHPARSVTQAEREFIFERRRDDEARVILYDRVSLMKPTFGARWAVHGAAPPTVSGGVARIASGHSVAVVTTLLPTAATSSILREPTVQSDAAFTRNEPAEGLTSSRLEIGSPLRSLHPRFLNVVSVGDVDAKAPNMTRIEGQGADGVALDGSAFVFSAASQATPQAMMYRAPPDATRHVVAGLAPSGRYTISLWFDETSCRATVKPEGPLVASASGLLILAVKACHLTR